MAATATASITSSATAATTATTKDKIPDWTVIGDWFDACKCSVPCPCIFAQAPTYGDCDGVPAYHIKKGIYGQTQLDGLNVLALSYFRGNIWAAPPGKVVSRAEALTGPMTLAGKRVQTINVPGSEVGPDTVATRGRAITNKVDALGFKWEWNNRSSKHILFNWSGP